MKKLIALSLLFGLFFNVSAQKIDKEKLDSYFEALEENDKLMGSIVLSHEGRQVYSKVFGFSDFDNGIKSNRESKYRVGSITKMFTATLVFKAIEDNKIKLDDTIEEFFPDIKHANAITIDHLLNHKSGINNFTSNPDYLTWHTEPKNRKELYDIILAGGSDFEPNSKSQYSNANYVLLTWLMEDLYGKKYPTLIKEFITEPLKLPDTYVGVKTDAGSGETYSYTFAGNWKKEKETDMSIPLGAGAIVSTPRDLVRFIEGLFDGKVVSSASLEQMKTISGNFGRGMIRIPFNDKWSYGHTGGIDGFVSMLSYFPEEKFTLALITNGNNYDTNEAAIAALSAFFDVPYSIPSFVSLSAEELEKYVGTYESDSFPLDITITNQNNTLFGQATGQAAFPMEYKGDDTFTFTRAGLTIEFQPEDDNLTLKQGGGVHVLKRR